MNNIINQLEKNQIKQTIPNFRSGDIIEVKVWVVESSKKRLQSFEGIVISIRRKQGVNFKFTVRKISHGEGVERTFQVHSPIISSIIVKQHNTVRKAKLYYLRKKIGKSGRIKERLINYK